MILKKYALKAQFSTKKGKNSKKIYLNLLHFRGMPTPRKTNTYYQTRLI